MLMPTTGELMLCYLTLLPTQRENFDRLHILVRGPKFSNKSDRPTDDLRR